MNWVRDWPLNDDQWADRGERDERAEDRTQEAGGTDGIVFYDEDWNPQPADPALEAIVGLFVDMFERRDAA